MSFDGPQNRSRVRKIVEMLDLLHRSARTNRSTVGPDEEREMLGPVFEKLSDMGWAKALGAPPWETTTTKPQYTSVREMAENASLSELSYVVAIYINRVDEALSKEN